MPELAEVEFFRRQWNPGLGKKVTAVEVHPGKRIFRQAPTRKLRQLRGSRLIRSEARGKWLLFQFSNHSWLRLHLGMTGKLRSESANFVAGKHDHLVLHQKKQSLVFSDPRQFGQVFIHCGAAPPAFRDAFAPSPSSSRFTLVHLRAFLECHRKLPIKGTLLLQAGFPGIGNWMADEILWRAKLHPATLTGTVAQTVAPRLWKAVRFVATRALESIGATFDPPPGWLFHQRWSRSGTCPIHQIPLKRRSIAGRTTAWCPRCQMEETKDYGLCRVSRLAFYRTCRHS